MYFHKRTGISSVLFMAIRINLFQMSRQDKTTDVFILLISYGASNIFPAPTTLPDT